RPMTVQPSCTHMRPTSCQPRLTPSSTPTPSIPTFLFSSYRAHRDLHSFPTRRSSDLACFSAGTGDCRNFIGAGASVSGGDPSERSEEHTSELQSRSDLVCRLLLEKKKQ